MQRRNRRTTPETILTAVLQSINDAVVIKASDGTIALWNRAAAELFGYTAPEVIGENSDLLIPPSELRHWREYEKRLRGGGVMRRIHAVRVGKGGVRVRVIFAGAVVDKRRPASSEIVEIYRRSQATGIAAISAGR